MAAALDVREIEGLIHFLERCNLIHRLARLRIDRRHRHHAADLEVRVDLVALDDGFCRSEELMVGDLIEHLVAVLTRLIEHAGIREGRERRVDVALVVDLVERHPVLDLVLVALEDRDGEAHEEVDELAVAPAAVLRDEVVRHLEVRERDDRLHAVGMHRVEEIVVVLQALFIRLRLVAVREDARPGNTRAEALEAHLSKQRNVLFVAMVEVDGIVIRIDLARQDAVRDLTRLPRAADRHDVGNAYALAALFPAAFELMGSDGAAP